MAEHYRLAFGRKDAGIDADFLHHPADHLGAFFDSIVLAGNAGLPHQTSELLDKTIALGFHVFVDRLQIDQFIFCYRHILSSIPKIVRFASPSRSSLKVFPSSRTRFV